MDTVAAVHSAGLLRLCSGSRPSSSQPDGGQQRQMRRYAVACRFVYNQALALQNANFEARSANRR